MSQDIEHTDFEKAQALLPWYIKGSLSSEEETWVESQLAKSSLLREELELVKKQIQFTQDYVESLETEEFENQPARLNALQNRIKEQQIQKEKPMKNIKENPEKVSIWKKISGFLPQTQKQWQTTGAFALAIMVVQGVVISQLMSTSVEYSTLSGDRAGSQKDKVIFITAFKKDISVDQLELFLRKNSLSIVNGPDLEKQYRLLLEGTEQGKKLSEEEINELVFSLVDNNRVIDFIFRE